jgi:hypothetical protein
MNGLVFFPYSPSSVKFANHRIISFSLQVFFFPAVFYAVNNNITLSLSCKNINPIDHLKCPEIQLVLFVYLVCFCVRVLMLACKIVS